MLAPLVLDDSAHKHFVAYQLKEWITETCTKVGEAPAQFLEQIEATCVAFFEPTLESGPTFNKLATAWAPAVVSTLEQLQEKARKAAQGQALIVPQAGRTPPPIQQLPLKRPRSPSH